MESDNPYAPPKAAVADVASGGGPARPAQVTRAVLLLWVALVLGLGAGILNSYLLLPPGSFQGAFQGSILIMLLLGYPVGILLVWWILSSIKKGKNWARIVQLVLLTIGVLSMLATLAMPALVAPVIWVFYVARMGLMLWATILLFSGPGGAWFREMKGRA